MLFALALALKFLLPGGFMTVAQGKTMTIMLCASSGPASITIQMPMESDHKPGSDKAADTHCAFSSLGSPALAAADPVLLEAALLFAFVLALLAPTLPLVRRHPYLRPPLRGPPVIV
jgi:hypothetical protein